MYDIPWSGPDDVSLYVVGVSLFVCKVRRSKREVTHHRGQLSGQVLGFLLDAFLQFSLCCLQSLCLQVGLNTHLLK